MRVTIGAPGRGMFLSSHRTERVYTRPHIPGLEEHVAKRAHFNAYNSKSLQDLGLGGDVSNPAVVVEPDLRKDV